MLLFLNLGGGEVFVVVLVFLLLFGAKNIPDVARGLGKAMREFKDATGNIQREIENSSTSIKREINKHSQEIKDQTDISKQLKD